MKKLLFLLALCAYGFILHVPLEYSTIQSGINAASEGDTVLVAPGIYLGEGNRDLTYKGKAITVLYDIKEVVICVTNRSIVLYQPRKNRAYDYDLTDFIDFSYKRGFFSSEIRIHRACTRTDNLDTGEEIEWIKIRGVSKGEEEQVISLLKETVERRKRFKDEQKSKGLFPYGFSLDKWGSEEEAKKWLDQY